MRPLEKVKVDEENLLFCLVMGDYFCLDTKGIFTSSTTNNVFWLRGMPCMYVFHGRIWCRSRRVFALSCLFTYKPSLIHAYGPWLETATLLDNCPDINPGAHLLVLICSSGFLVKACLSWSNIFWRTV